MVQAVLISRKETSQKHWFGLNEEKKYKRPVHFFIKRFYTLRFFDENSDRRSYQPHSSTNLYVCMLCLFWPGAVSLDQSMQFALCIHSDSTLLESSSPHNHCQLSPAVHGAHSWERRKTSQAEAKLNFLLNNLHPRITGCLKTAINFVFNWVL